jgi:hypothetical protein
VSRPANLQAAVDQVYTAFQHVPRPAQLDASPTHEAAEIKALTSAPLNQLTDDAIGAYASSAIWTIGGSRDYAYYLPRILELAIRDPVWIGVEPAVIAKKLQLADWRKWRDTQQAAVTQLFETVFHSALESSPATGLMAGAWLCGLVALGLDAEPYLAAWEQRKSPQAGLQLAHFLNEALEADGSVSGAWWGEQPEPATRTVARWLLAEERQSALVDAAGRFGPDQDWDLELALMNWERAVSAQSSARRSDGAAGED